MDFFYPNWINDFWRIQGVIHFGDKGYFEETCNPLKRGVADEQMKVKRFDKKQIVDFCIDKGIALFDTAQKVCRLKDNADDNFLEIVEGTDLFALLKQIPECKTIVTTGGKASEELQEYLRKKGIKVKIPKVGEWVVLNENEDANEDENSLRWWRMPSTSRAYPMKLEQKAEFYRRLFM